MCASMLKHSKELTSFSPVRIVQFPESRDFFSESRIPLLFVHIPSLEDISESRAREEFCREVEIPSIPRYKSNTDLVITAQQQID